MLFVHPRVQCNTLKRNSIGLSSKRKRQYYKCASYLTLKTGVGVFLLTVLDWGRFHLGKQKENLT